MLGAQAARLPEREARKIARTFRVPGGTRAGEAERRSQEERCSQPKHLIVSDIELTIFTLSTPPEVFRLKKFSGGLPDFPRSPRVSSQKQDHNEPRPERRAHLKRRRETDVVKDQRRVHRRVEERVPNPKD